MINRLHKCACLSFYNNVRKCALEIMHSSLCNVLFTLVQWIVGIRVYQYDFDSNHKNRFRFREPRRPIVTYYNNSNTLSCLIKTNNYHFLFSLLIRLRTFSVESGPEDETWVRINGFRTREIDITRTRFKTTRDWFFFFLCNRIIARVAITVD